MRTLLVTAACLCSLCKLANADVEEYRDELAKVLGFGAPHANLTVDHLGMLRTARPYTMGELVLTVQSEYVLTVKRGLALLGPYFKAARDALGSTLSRQFVLTMMLMHIKHAKKPLPGHDLFRLWLEVLPPADPPYLWSSDLIEELEDPLLFGRITESRRVLHNEFKMALATIKESTLADVVNASAYTFDEYSRVSATVAIASLRLAEDFPVLVPLYLCHHPVASTQLFEYGEDQEKPSIALYAGVENSQITVGTVVTVHTDLKSDILMVHLGLATDERRATFVTLPFDASKTIQSAERDEVRALAGWKLTQAFALEWEQLPADLLPWMRLAFADVDEFEDIFADGAEVALGRLRAPSSSRRLEEVAIGAVRRQIETSLGENSYSVEQERALLKGKSHKGPHGYEGRFERAVVYRMTRKELLHATDRMLEETLERYHAAASKKRRKRTAKAKRKAKSEL